MECNLWVYSESVNCGPRTLSGRSRTGNMASMFGLPESLAETGPDGEIDPILDVLARIAKKFGKSNNLCNWNGVCILCRCL